MENKAHVACSKYVDEVIDNSIVWPCLSVERGDSTRYYCGICGWQDLATPCTHHPGVSVVS